MSEYSKMIFMSPESERKFSEMEDSGITWAASLLASMMNEAQEKIFKNIKLEMENTEVQNG